MNLTHNADLEPVISTHLPFAAVCDVLGPQEYYVVKGSAGSTMSHAFNGDTNPAHGGQAFAGATFTHSNLNFSNTAYG